MTSKQLFPSSLEQVTLTSPGVWLTTKKRGRDDDKIVRDAAAAVSARKHRRSRSNGSRSSVRSNVTPVERVSPSLLLQEMSELTNPTLNDVPDFTRKALKADSSDSDDSAFIQRRKRRRPNTHDRSKNSTPSSTSKKKSNADVKATEEKKTSTIKCHATEGRKKNPICENKLQATTSEEDSIVRLQGEVASLENKIEPKNKLIMKYRAKLREMVHAATDVLMLTGEE